MLEYHAAYYVIEDGWYMAEVTDYPGVISQGKTLRSARRMIRDALRTMAEYDMEQGRPLPRPNAKAKLSEGKPAFRETIRLYCRPRVGGVR
jgi:predicted RNase H-like HicB family nuclease